MLANLPSDFTAELLKTSRQPVQLCVFIVSGKKYYLSDMERTIAGNTYQPWVESWGELVDNSSIEALFGGQSIGFRTCDITLINSLVSNQFIQILFNDGVENTVVELYQWFEGMTSPPVLIDEFVCQDPISITESSMLVDITLVSTLAATNRRLYPVKASDKHYPVVIGTVKGLPLIDLKTGASATLAQDLKFNGSGWVSFDIHDNMPNSGYMFIDEELLHYSKKRSNALYINKRAYGGGGAALPHAQGALAVLHGTVFTYAICAGRVKQISAVVSDGVAVSGYTTHPTLNPATVTFKQWPPNIGVADGRTNIASPITTQYNERRGFRHASNLAGGMFGWGSRVTISSGFKGMYVDTIDVAHQTYSGYSVSVNIKYRVFDLLKGSRMRVTFGYSHNSMPHRLSDVIAISQTEVSVSQNMLSEAEVSCGRLTYEQMQNRVSSGYTFHCIFEIFGEGDTAGSAPKGTFQCYRPMANVDYAVTTTPVPIPQERVRAFVHNLTCTVKSVYPDNITPPKLIRFLIANYTNATVDLADFNLEDRRYIAAKYFLNGVIPAGIRLKEAIKLVLFEGLGRLRYNQGKIQFLSYFDDLDSTVDSTLSNDDIVLRSRFIEHQSTESIINNVEVSYGYDQVLGEYDGIIKSSDPDSIAKFGRKDLERELTLISEYSVANMYASRIIEVMKNSPEVMSFDTLLPKGYAIEKGDKVSIPGFVNRHHTVIGNVLSVTRTFGQGKTDQINKFNIKLAQLDYMLVLRLFDSFVIDDTRLQLPRALRILDPVIIDDHNLDLPRDVYLKLVENLVVDDVTLSLGTLKTLTLPTETIALTDKDISNTLCYGYGDCGYGMKPYGD